MKVKETLNRPRFFYINIIYPKTFNYYNRVVKFYGKLLKRKPFSHKLILLFSELSLISKYKQFVNNKLNNFFKNTKLNTNNINSLFLNLYHNKIDDINSMNYKEYTIKSNNDSFSRIVMQPGNKEDLNVCIEIPKIGSGSFKRRIYLLNKLNNVSNIDYILNIKKRKKVNLFHKLDKIHIISVVEEGDVNVNKKNKKVLNNKKSQYEIYKKYLEEFNVKSNTPFNLKGLTL
jgi:hypothetical protein